MKILNWTSGKKTYALAIIAVIYGAVGWIMGFIEPLTAQEVIWGGLTAMALRNGIK